MRTPRKRGAFVKSTAIDTAAPAEAGLTLPMTASAHFALAAVLAALMAMSEAAAKLLPAASTACLACA